MNVNSMFESGMLLFLLSLLLVTPPVCAARPTVAVCFFGLTRSLGATIANIEQRLLKPLRLVADVSVFVHTYNVSFVTNPRSNEANAPNNVSDLFLLNPSAFEIGNMSQFLETIPPSYCQQHGDAWNDGFMSLRNFFCQLNSLEHVTAFLAGAVFDFVVFARPDVLFFTPIDVFQLLNATDGEIYVPQFHSFGGVNDRFAFGKQKEMIAYGRRLASLTEYCVSKQAHSETFLAWFLGKQQIRARSTPILFGRVRAPNVLWEEAVLDVRRVHDVYVTSSTMRIK